MRRQIYLFIGDELCDLGDDSFVLLNYKREDLESPAAVLNAWSQSIELPRTAANDKIFGHYYRLDHISLSGGGTGTAFSALKRTPFRIYDTKDNILQSGYVKLERVTAQAFSVTLYGGLGSMFFSLMYADGGNDKLTLAACKFSYGGTYYKAHEISFPATRSNLASAWARLIDYGAPSSGTKYDILNFAPALNGTQYPFKFDTNKIIVKQGGSGLYNYIANIYTTKTEGGVTYGPMKDANNQDLPLLVELGGKHNEWEVQDLRCYLQRPVLSLRKLLDAIVKFASDAGYTLTIDPSFAASTNYWFERVWMTLPFINRDNYTYAQMNALTLADYLVGTASPADYLLAIAKTFGFIFLPEKDGVTVRMLLRKNFYEACVPVDLTERVDLSKEDELLPVNMQSRFYEWKFPKVQGAFAADYEVKNGRVYGSQLVDTLYEFSAEKIEVEEKIALAGCADVLDASDNYRVVWGETELLGLTRSTRAINYQLKFALTESVRWTLYHYETSGGETSIDKTLDCEPVRVGVDGWPGPGWSGYESGGYGGAQEMWFNLPQLCDKDGKAVEGANILLFYEEPTTFPEYKEEWAAKTTFQAIFTYTEDDQKYFEALNGGTPCWMMVWNDDHSATAYGSTKLPSFRRWHYDDGKMVGSLDFGDPVERAATGTFAPDKNIYTKFWADYIADRLDMNTTVLRAYVNLEGLDVGEALFRKFYAYGGSWWVLNAIENHSLTTADTTLCEFVRVNDIGGYTGLGDLLEQTIPEENASETKAPSTKAVSDALNIIYDRLAALEE